MRDAVMTVIIKIYKGKATWGKSQTVMVRRVRAELIAPVINGHAFSVSGYLYDLTTVGTPAIPSAMILKIIAIVPVWVRSHRIRPMTDMIPQKISNLLIFHSDFLFTNEATKMVKGKNPTLNVISD